MSTRHELSFDGCGINGPDEYRTRIATFTVVRGPEAKKYGPLFAAAPTMLEMLLEALPLVEEGEQYHKASCRTLSKRIRELLEANP